MPERISRRRMLGAVAIGAGAAVATGRRSAAATGFKVNDTKVISHQPNLYNGWPTVARRRNGELLLVCSGGRESHVCPYGRVELMRSTDGGDTWSWPRILIDGPIDDRDAGVLETARGTLLVTTFTSLAWDDRLAAAEKKGEVGSEKWPKEMVERWHAVRRRLPSEERKKLLTQSMIRSTDGGVSWTPTYYSIVNSPHGPIQLNDGRLLYPGATIFERTQRVGVCESLDDGKSWRWSTAIAARPGDTTDGYHELHGVEVSPGHVVVHIRNHNKKNEGETLQTESHDGGQTWTLPHPIGVWGLPSHLLCLRDGRLVMSYGHRRPPFGNQARVSSDGGRTWSEPLLLSTDGPGRDLGYPSTVELDDGSLLTVWYEVRPGSHFAVLRQARWTL